MKARIRTIMLVPLTGLLLVACGSGDDAPPAPTVAVEPTAPTAALPPSTVTVSDIVWTTDVAVDTGAPVDELAALPDNAPQVVAAMQVDTLPEGVTLQARWTIDGEPLPALEPEPLVIEEARTDAWVAWTLAWGSDQPWPIGQLGIAIEVNGEVRASDEIFIVRAHDEG